MLINNDKNNNLNDNSENIIHSLGYLMEEAKRNGSDELYEIMKMAYVLGQKSHCHVEHEYDDSTLKGAQFIFHFLGSSEDTQKEVLSLIVNDVTEVSIT